MLTISLHLAVMVKALVPATIPDTERQIALSQHLLRPFSSHVANVHLFVLALDLITGKVFPELVIPPEE